MKLDDCIIGLTREEKSCIGYLVVDEFCWMNPHCPVCLVVAGSVVKCFGPYSTETVFRQVDYIKR